jgi:electron transfer flavoprotein beta subunit
MKQVLDPEAPASTYQVDAEARQVIQRGVPPVMNPFDENALEAALKIKDSGDAAITILSMARSVSKPLARKAMAAGADQVILLEDGAFENLDDYTVASVLAAAIKKIGKYDLILTGREAADTNAGIVGSGIAEHLGIPSVTLARKVEVDDGKARVERVVSDGYEVIDAALPVLVTISNEIGGLRSVPVKELMAAQKKPVTSWSAQDIGVQPAESGRARLVDIFIPQTDVSCEFVEGETEEELGKNLASRLRGEEII